MEAGLIFMHQLPSRQREKAMVERVAAFVRRRDGPAAMGDCEIEASPRDKSAPLESPEGGSNLVRLPLW